MLDIKKQVALSMLLGLCMNPLDAMDNNSQNNYGYLSRLYNSAKNYMSTSYLPYVPLMTSIVSSGPLLLYGMDKTLYGVANSFLPSAEDPAILAGLIGHYIAPFVASGLQVTQRYSMKPDKRFNKIIYGAPLLMQAAGYIASRLILGESIVSILRDTPILNTLKALGPSLMSAFLAVVTEYVADYYNHEEEQEHPSLEELTKNSEVKRKSGL